MITPIEEIKEWFHWRNAKTHTHMLIATTNEDPDEYPVYVPIGMQIAAFEKVYSERGNTIHKTFDYSQDFETQIK
jgi:hypothetical protein